MNVKNKIEEILLTEYQCIDYNTVDKLLDLFAVSGQSEQLKAFDELFDYAWNLAQHSEEHAKLNEIRERF